MEWSGVEWSEVDRTGRHRTAQDGTGRHRTGQTKRGETALRARAAFSLGVCGVNRGPDHDRLLAARPRGRRRRNTKEQRPQYPPRHTAGGVRAACRAPPPCSFSAPCQCHACPFHLPPSCALWAIVSDACVGGAWGAGRRGPLVHITRITHAYRCLRAVYPRG